MTLMELTDLVLMWMYVGLFVVIGGTIIASPVKGLL
jgi:hypothetical protein